MTEPFRIVKEMGISHAEFFRVLPKLLQGVESETEGNRVRIHEDGGSVEIVLGPEQVRSLGLVRLPYTNVELIFHQLDEARRRAFVAEFELQFFRGGG